MNNSQIYGLTHQRGWFCPHGVEFFVRPDTEPIAPYVPADETDQHLCGMPLHRKDDE